MTKHNWISDKIPGIGVAQVPLILAWALTIHKSQGASLDAAEIDVGSGIFECGQTYVALSRVRSLDGLYLTSFDVSKIRINKKVKDFYELLQSKCIKEEDIIEKEEHVIENEKEEEHVIEKEKDIIEKEENNNNPFMKFQYVESKKNILSESSNIKVIKII
jgi:hypothetical protein